MSWKTREAFALCCCSEKCSPRGTTQAHSLCSSLSQKKLKYIFLYIDIYYIYKNINLLPVVTYCYMLHLDMCCCHFLYIHIFFTDTPRCCRDLMRSPRAHCPLSGVTPAPQACRRVAAQAEPEGTKGCARSWLL